MNLTEKAAAWAAADKRYREVAPYIYGARMLRQHPVECLFEFICSSNNHISRIGGMVEHLCKAYGSPLDVPAEALSDIEQLCSVPSPGKASAEAEPTDTAQPRLRYHAFPSVQQLQAATEGSLRENGFGYRARYIVETARLLQEKEQGVHSAIPC